MTTSTELEDALSQPSEADVEFLRQLDGDILILGAAGKMGPSLARLCRRAADASGRARRIFAVSRRQAAEEGIEVGDEEFMLGHGRVSFRVRLVNRSGCW